jgi:DHA2 family multidrug resistance protein
MVTVLLARNLQVSHSDLAAHVTPYSLPPIDSALTQGAPFSDAVLAMIDAEINRQALMIAYLDDFHLMMIISLLAIPMLLLLRKGRKPEGAPASVAD